MRSRLALTVAAAAAAAAAAAVVAVLPPSTATAAATPNIFFYNLDDLRDAFPGGSGIDPLQYMPKARQWMTGNDSSVRYRQSFVADPSCCPSRASLMTGRYPHNNGVRNQQDGPSFARQYSMACYLQRAGYATYMAGKFLTTWPKTTVPPCFSHSSVIWGGYNNTAARVDGVSTRANGYSTTWLGARGRQYITEALQGTAPFLLYETPQAPHWSQYTKPDGTVARFAIPDTKYANAAVASCVGAQEPNRADKPAYVRTMNYSSAMGQEMCVSQMRAIMTADDEFGATMQLLQDRGALANTLVILSSDNGYMWSEHGRWEKFVPYEPAIRVPLLIRWPTQLTGVPTGVNSSRLVSYVDLLPTMLQVAGVTRPATAPVLDGESLLRASTRTTLYLEYYNDPANSNIPSWRMVRTATEKYAHTLNAQGAVIAREYYNLANDPNEFTNLLGDGIASNDPPATVITSLRSRLNAMSTCAGTACVR